MVCALLALGCDNAGEEPVSDPGVAGGKQDDTSDEDDFPLEPPSAMTMRGDTPGLFRVVDVSDDDVLNVRSAPDASAPIVSSLDPDATGVEIVGSDFSGEWGIVNLAGIGSGWVSMRFLESHDDVWPPERLPEHLSCFGTEPFWSFAAEGDAISFHSPDLEEGRMDIQEVLLPEGFTAAMPSRVFMAEDEVAGISATTTLTPGLCSDGASDQTWGINAAVILDLGEHKTFLYGCCSLEED